MVKQLRGVQCEWLQSTRGKLPGMKLRRKVQDDSSCATENSDPATSSYAATIGLFSCKLEITFPTSCSTWFPAFNRCLSIYWIWILEWRGRMGLKNHGTVGWAVSLWNMQEEEKVYFWSHLGFPVLCPMRWQVRFSLNAQVLCKLWLPKIQGTESPQQLPHFSCHEFCIKP